MKLRDYLNLCESYELSERNRGERGMSDLQVRRRRDERDFGYIPGGTGPGVRVGGLQRMAHDKSRGKKRPPKGKVTSAMRGPNDNVSNYYSMHSEELEAVLGYLLDEGFADSYETAAVIYENMSDEWLDEAQHQIMSVSRGGKQVYKVPRKELQRPSNEPTAHQKRRMAQRERARRNADRRGEESPARERGFDRFVGGTDTPLNRIRTSNIKKLNAPEELDYNYDPYNEVPTDYRARKRRASGR